MRNQARAEAQGRRRGAGGEMTSDFLERDGDGDLGNIRNAYKRGRFMVRAQTTPEHGALGLEKHAVGCRLPTAVTRCVPFSHDVYEYDAFRSTPPVPVCPCAS